MSLRAFATLASLSLLVALAAAPMAMAGGPTREVIDLDDPAFDIEESAALTEQCGFPVAADNSGHIAFTLFPAGRNRMLEIDHYNIHTTYTNLATGRQVRLHDSGPDRFYTKGGRLLVAVTGRSTTGTGVIGQTVIDLESGEIVKQVGNEVGLFQDQVCAALAG